MAYDMYLNNGEYLHNHQGNNSNLMVSQPESISRSISDAASNQKNKTINSLKAEEINGIRMKRYNSLPDVAEYLDPNTQEQSKSSSMANNYNNPQINSLMAAFSQGQIDRKGFKPGFENQVMSDPRLQASHLSTPMSGNVSTSSSMYQHSPSPQVQNSQFSAQESSQVGYNNKKRELESESNLMSNYPSSHLGYPNEPMSSLTNMDMLHPTQINQPNPHFTPQQVYIPQNIFKQPRNDHPNFNGYMPPNMYDMQNPVRDMGMVMPVQPAPAPDPATTQAANDAIAASSQYPPPSEDNGDPDQVPRRQHLRYHGDLYTPQWVRGTGHKKEGYCDLCSPGKWLQLKNSAFWYHKQFFHGISSVSGKFFSGPLQTRQKDPDVVEGSCHQCQQWVQMSSPKRRNSVLWFRHAHKCHVYHKPKNVYGKKE